MLIAAVITVGHYQVCGYHTRCGVADWASTGLWLPTLVVVSLRGTIIVSLSPFAPKRIRVIQRCVVYIIAVMEEDPRAVFFVKSGSNRRGVETVHTQKGAEGSVSRLLTLLLMPFGGDQACLDPPHFSTIRIVLRRQGINLKLIPSSFSPSPVIGSIQLPDW